MLLIIFISLKFGGIEMSRFPPFYLVFGNDRLRFLAKSQFVCVRKSAPTAQVLRVAGSVQVVSPPGQRQFSVALPQQGIDLEAGHFHWGIEQWDLMVI